jgi:hypothetical protein
LPLKPGNVEAQRRSRTVVVRRQVRAGEPKAVLQVRIVGERVDVLEAGGGVDRRDGAAGPVVSVTWARAARGGARDGDAEDERAEAGHGADPSGSRRGSVLEDGSGPRQARGRTRTG